MKFLTFNFVKVIKSLDIFFDQSNCFIAKSKSYRPESANKINIVKAMKWKTTLIKKKKLLGLGGALTIGLN